MVDSQLELRRRNLDFFLAFAPEIHERLKEFDVEGAADYAPLAPGSIPSVRFTVPKPARNEVDAYTFDVVADMLARARSENIPMIDWPRTEQSFFLFVLGTQHHATLMDLLARTRCNSVMFIEPDLEALTWSLDHTDWGQVITEVQNRGGTVDFIFDTTPEDIAASIWRTMRFINPTCADGAMFTPYGYPDLAKDLGSQLTNDIALSYTSLGFFYDESLMIWNTYRNLTQQDAHIFQRNLEQKVETPVFVVASGPSLDDSIATIKAHAGDAVIISCGSALRPLLVNGIVPDFQIETENAQVSPLTLQSAREHDLSGMILVASTTIDPDVLGEFRDIIFFFRSSLSSFPLFAPSYNCTLFMPDPTVGNAGLSFALELGFREIYMFGMDCGSRSDQQHHSKDAYHYTADADEVDIRYAIPVPANFGGQSLTNFGLFASINNFVEMLKVFREDRDIFNCSDGALITGATPLKQSDLKISHKGPDKRDVVSDIVNAMPSYLSAEQDFVWMGDTFTETVHGYCDLVRERLSGVEDFTKKDYQGRLMELFQPRISYFIPPPKGVNHCINILIRGSLFAMLLFFERYLARVASERDIQRFGEIGIEAILGGLAILERDAIERFGGEAPLPPPSLDTIFRSADVPMPVPAAPTRNSPCPCGSGRKFKHCHGRTA